MNKHLVTFNGNGIWKDKEGKLWSRDRQNGNDILMSREYNSDLDKDSFLQDRSDFDFMIKYGSMSIASLDGNTETKIEIEIDNQFIDDEVVDVIGIADDIEVQEEVQEVDEIKEVDEVAKEETKPIEIKPIKKK